MRGEVEGGVPTREADQIYDMDGKIRVQHEVESSRLPGKMQPIVPMLYSSIQLLLIASPESALLLSSDIKTSSSFRLK